MITKVCQDVFTNQSSRRSGVVWERSGVVWGWSGAGDVWGKALGVSWRLLGLVGTFSCGLPGDSGATLLNKSYQSLMTLPTKPDGN